MEASLVRLKHLVCKLILVNPSNECPKLRIVMILDGVIRAAGYVLGYLGPLIRVDFVSLHKDKFFVMVPCRFSDGGVELIVPSLSALFPISIGEIYSFLELLCNAIPFLLSQLLDQQNDEHVLLDRPLHLFWFHEAV